jgi:hypothetical protein
MLLFISNYRQVRDIFAQSITAKMQQQMFLVLFALFAMVNKL